MKIFIFIFANFIFAHEFARFSIKRVRFPQVPKTHSSASQLYIKINQEKNSKCVSFKSSLFQLIIYKNNFMGEKFETLVQPMNIVK